MFDLSWFHVNCKPKNTKTIMGLIVKACTERCCSTHTFQEQNLYPLQNSKKKLQVKAEFTETCPLAACCPAILWFRTGMDATLLIYMCLRACGLLQSFQWCSSVGCNIQSLFSGIPMWDTFFQWCAGVPCKYSLGRPVDSRCALGQPVAFQWHSTVYWTSQCTLVVQGNGVPPHVYCS